jgi:hypothetical protein
MEAREKIRNKMKEMIEDKSGYCKIFYELNKRGKKIECLELSRNIRQIW